MWYVYIVRCSDGTLYTGATNDIEARVNCHNSGKGAKYTRGRRPVELIYSQECQTREEALKEEYRIKGYTREKKENLTGKGG